MLEEAKTGFIAKSSLLREFPMKLVPKMEARKSASSGKNHCITAQWLFMFVQFSVRLSCVCDKLVRCPQTFIKPVASFPAISWLTNLPESTILASLSHSTVAQHSSFVDRSWQCGSKFRIFPRGTKTPWHLASQIHLPALWQMQRSSHPFSRISPTCW